MSAVQSLRSVHKRPTVRHGQRPWTSFGAFVTAVEIITTIIIGCNVQARASDLILRREALQALVANALFRDGGRWYAKRGDCYGYLERPEVALVQGRMVLNAHLSARLGVEAFGQCIGPGVASNVALSGELHGTGSALTLEDIRVDRVDDDWTRSAATLLGRVAPDALHRAINVDLMTIIKPTNLPVCRYRFGYCGSK